MFPIGTLVKIKPEISNRYHYPRFNTWDIYEIIEVYDDIAELRCHNRKVYSTKHIHHYNLIYAGNPLEEFLYSL